MWNFSDALMTLSDVSDDTCMTSSVSDISVRTSGVAIFHVFIKFMDKFLVRKTIGTSSSSSSSVTVSLGKGERRQRQATIESLSGVVVLKDVECSKQALLSDASPEVILENLRKLKRKTPSKEVIRDTGIGRVVRQLRRHTDPRVAREANELYTAWKDRIIELSKRELLPVRTDLKTASFRDRARGLLTKSLQSSPDFAPDSDLVSALELEVFHQNKQLVGDPYRRKMRGVVFALRNSNLRQDFVLGKLTARQLCDQANRTLWPFCRRLTRVS